MKNKYKKMIGRFGFGAVGVTLVIFGAITLKSGQLHYSNYWGSPVFAPISIVVGLAIILLAIFKWEKLYKIK